MRRFMILFAAFGLVACNETAPPETDGAARPEPVEDDSADAAAPAARKPPGPPAGPSGTDELEHLEGRTEAALVAELGEPDRKRAFEMRECCTEFQIELYNTYPPDEPAHAEVPIREWTWVYDGYALTVWLHRVGEDWVVLDTSRYADDVEF